MGGCGGGGGGGSGGGGSCGGGGGKGGGGGLGGGVGEEELASGRLPGWMGRRIRPFVKRSLTEIYAATPNVAAATVLEDAIEESKAREVETFTGMKEILGRQSGPMGRRFRPIMKRSLAEIYAVAADIVAAPAFEDATEEIKVGEKETIIGMKEISPLQLGWMGRSSRPIMMRSLVEIHVTTLDVFAASVVVDGIEESKAREEENITWKKEISARQPVWMHRGNKADEHRERDASVKSKCLLLETN